MIGEQEDRFTAASVAGVPATRILGVPVSLVGLEAAVAIILGWVERGQAQYVCVRDVHGVMRAQENPDLMALHETAGLVTPDGMPLVWLARYRGHSEVTQACGSDLMIELCQASLDRNIRHYFYGGKQGVAERLAAVLAKRFLGLQIVGTYCPPFRPLTPEEDVEIIDSIVATRPHIVWVGLSTPIQEFWMRDHVDLIPGATLMGVGAAFDFHTGDVKRAPQWMRRRGLEWLHRLWSEPRRLWRRYLVLAPQFVSKVIREELRR